MRKHYNTFKKKKIRKLRNLKSNNSKEYWKILNARKKGNNTDCSIGDFFDYFKSFNGGENEAEDVNFSDNTLNEEVNKSITKDKVEKAINMLKNNKSCSLDSILNEHLKASKSVMSDIFVKLFNAILDAGYFPSQWGVGVIKPIYKNKCLKSDPKNYRPISLVSCFSKLFTSIINERLNKFAEENDVINSNQAGFRKGFSTTDNLFVLYALIIFLEKSKKKQFCSFVDFKGAFDTVWRVGLWKKLLMHRIDGKVFNIIRNMYEGIKSCVVQNNEYSHFFQL